jgi:hypothetical protein
VGDAVSCGVGATRGVSVGDPVGDAVSSGVGSETGDLLGVSVSVDCGTDTGTGAGGVGGTAVGGSGETIKLYSSVASQDSPSGCGSASITILAENSPPEQMSTSRFGLIAVDSPTSIGLVCSMSTKLNDSLSNVKSAVVTFIGTLPTLLISNV